MLFWLFVILFVIGVACIVSGWWMYENTKYDTEWLNMLGWVIAIVAAIAVIICTAIMISSYAGVDAKVAENHEIYKSLTYQLQNDFYDNDNDLGKKELYNQIQEWNMDLAYYQNIQDNFWLGIFYPDVFDQFEFIEMNGGGEG